MTGTSKTRLSVLFVCMGNICRSPTAEGVFRAIVQRDFPDLEIEIASAGTHAYHIGDPPDHRAQSAAQRRGYDLSTIRARRVSDADFLRYEYVVAMDQENLAMLKSQCPPPEQHRLRLFLEFASEQNRDDIPDPYYGGSNGFEKVLDLVEEAATGLADAIAATRQHPEKKRRPAKPAL